MTRKTRRRFFACLVCTSLATQFAVMLDVATMDVALPAIGHDLGVAGADLTWIVNSYVVAVAALLLVGGRLTDVLGAGRSLRLGGVLFMLAGVASLAAPAAGWFLAARALQGAGAALLLPAALAVVTRASPDDQRARAMAGWATLGELGAVAGLLLTGALTELASWRLVFAVDVVAGATIALTASAAPPTPRRPAPPPDPVSALTAFGALTALVVGVVAAQDGPLRTVPLVALGAALTLGGAFAARERRVRAPLLPAQALTRRRVQALGAIGMVSGATYGMWLVLTLDLQGHRGLSPFATALAFLPLSGGLVAGAWAAARLTGSLGHHAVAMLGGLTAAAGLGGLAGGGDGYIVAVLVPSLVATAGVGAATTSLAAVATASLRLDLDGVLSGLLGTSRQIGGAIGIAVLGTVQAGSGATAAYAAGGSVLVAASVLTVRLHRATGHPTAT
jgi:MFS family permease